MDPIIALGLSVAAFAVTWAGIRSLIPALIRRALLDLPDARRNHKTPIPRGAGFALFPVVALCLSIGLVFGLPTGLPAASEMSFLAIAVALAIVSAFDDLIGLRAATRFIAQAGLVAAAVASLPLSLSLSPELPLLVERIVLWFFLLSFVNAYNFMDGIDGITGVTTIAIAIGFLLIAAPAGHLPLLPCLLIAASLGFLLHNWHPAKIFLGDAGSVFAGFCVGSLLVALALDGELAAALILPAYYLTDTGLTLFIRARRGERIWLAHSEHAYQKAVRRGWRHDQVVLALALNSGVCIALALISTRAPYAAFTMAYASSLTFWVALRFGMFDALAFRLSARRK
ncbi:UDP-N-acetylmuramyl pentapeptide phosphotransferase/UDP-N-acetylglucosamine-1-phosphate transferase [Rhodopseudomonas julia]|uniref:UDP-N-acetylmuramyl pentapeptide phosphotransferase/UDP-N-acetylglucosamine-1-phosphate transferase n=1 Tax=Rhodopseudomonas julia TaxID=200617 RepID=A0ABU0C6P9_9BRAD|nr:glycosyltransferase family 4 protein [Rhodopseudomonas julia]MDQ0326164.1 UDP-N-acetylmuramyl pentapeptide phosphotransferase/UDP-N-acetylglucosamine-1-phosphate transferase [Rhodopseudomonas julia]